MKYLNTNINNILIRLLLVESSVIVTFYMIFLCGNYYYFLKFFFLTKRKQGVHNSFKPLISSVFNTIASGLKSNQKEKEK